MDAQEERNLEIVLDFFRAMGTGPRTELRRVIHDFLDEEVVWENPGLPTVRSRAEAMATFFDESRVVGDGDVDDGIQRIEVTVRHLAASGDLVFSERVDHHFDARGVDVLAPEICGVMRLREGRCVEWRDYFDPSCLPGAGHEDG